MIRLRNCTSTADFGVVSGNRVYGACARHLAKAVTRVSERDGRAVVAPVHEPRACQVPSETPFGFTSQRMDDSSRCGKHAPGTCNGYGTECVPRHTSEEILAHRRAEGGQL